MGEVRASGSGAPTWTVLCGLAMDDYSATAGLGTVPTAAAKACTSLPQYR